MAAPSRRAALRTGLLLGGAVVVMARPWRNWAAPDLAFEDLDGLPPLRRLIDRGETSLPTGAGALAGLDQRTAPDRADLREALAADLCGALGLSDWTSPEVPVSYFTDIRCPSCRVLEARLSRLADTGDTPFTLRTREYPVFGPRSEAAARIIVAGRNQGAGDTLRAVLQRRPPPETAHAVRDLGHGLALDGDALATAWAAPATADRLAEDRALASLLRLPGTPGLVIGRTIVIGARSEAVLAALLAAEAREGPPRDCT